MKLTDEQLNDRITSLTCCKNTGFITDKQEMELSAYEELQNYRKAIGMIGQTKWVNVGGEPKVIVVGWLMYNRSGLFVGWLDVNHTEHQLGATYIYDTREEAEAALEERR